MEIRESDIGAGRYLVGHAAVFHSLSEDMGGWRERIRPGAFARAIRERQDVRALVNHDPNMVIGRTRSGTLGLVEDDVGLRVRVKLPATTYADDLREVMRRGDVSQMSFGFVVRLDHWLKENGQQVRELVNLDLLDVSVVAMPAYTGTDAQLAASSKGRSVGPHGRIHEEGMRLYASSLRFGTVTDDVQRLVSRLQGSCDECARAGHALLKLRLERARIQMSLMRAAA